MATKKEMQTFNVALAGIELISSYVQPMENVSLVEANFVFNVEVQSKINLEKFIIVRVAIDAIDSVNKNNVGGIAVNYIYKLDNFDECIKPKTDGGADYEMPINLLDILNSIAISTSRGIIFSTFKGTYLHNLTLPIIDPKTLVK